MSEKTKQIHLGTIQKSSEAGYFEGYASMGTMDRDGDIILPSAFEKTLPAFLKAGAILAGHRSQGQNGQSLVIAKPVDARIDAKGLYIKAQFAPTDLAKEYEKLITGGFLTGMSVGFIGKTWEDTKNADGSYGPRVFKDVELLEISVTPVPANRDALIQARGKEFSPEMVDAILKSMNEDRSSKESSQLSAISLQLAELSKALKSLPTMEAIEAKMMEILGDVLAKDSEDDYSNEPNNHESDGDKESGSSTESELKALLARIETIAQKGK